MVYDQTTLDITSLGYRIMLKCVPMLNSETSYIARTLSVTAHTILKDNRVRSLKCARL